MVVTHLRLIGPRLRKLVYRDDPVFCSEIYRLLLNNCRCYAEGNRSVD